MVDAIYEKDMRAGLYTGVFCIENLHKNSGLKQWAQQDNQGDVLGCAIPWLGNAGSAEEIVLVGEAWKRGLDVFEKKANF
jgi:hypothetical protein